jgi:hypothetical protein
MNSTPPPCTVARAHLLVSPSPSILLLARHAAHARCSHAAAGSQHPPPLSSLCEAHKVGPPPPPSSSPAGHKTSLPSPLHCLSLPCHLLPRSHVRDTPPLLPLLPVPTQASEIPPPSLEIVQRHHCPPFTGEAPPPLRHSPP